MNTKRILVVDDDQEFAQSIATRCRGLGYEAATAATPLEAVTNMTEHPPDLLCLDVELPSGNGLDLCEYLVHDVAETWIPVIVLTGHTDRETVFRSVLLRARYLYKSTNVWERLRPLIEKSLPMTAA